MIQPNRGDMPTRTAARKVAIAGKPLQVIPYSEKNTDWFKDNVDYYIGRSNFNLRRRRLR